ncbi:hypothetical protein K457DRAFT_138433 [Linnemannia elongata AG-77]|uniref:Uncharacterized protein n=1 Tax=Linnemannia elongata AG-77 TaxID=1314771 RepID=A0A197JW66_9FUNG|nr:hypothetical protein K457DRAFT_138433 [Linnemannia elongata AG-77]
MVTSLPSLPSTSSHSKKSTYIPRYDSTTHNNSPTAPSSPSSSSNNVQSISPLPTTSKNSRTRFHNHNSHVILPPPMAAFSSSPPDSPASSPGSSRCRSGKSSGSPSFHSMASLTPSIASSSYTQKMARREKRHFQSSSTTYSSSISSSPSGKSPSSSERNKKKGGVAFLASQPTLPFLNRSAPASASASALAQPASTAKPKDRFLTRSSLSFTALSKVSSSPRKSPLTAANTVAAPTPNSVSQKQQPAPKIALQPTPSTASNHSIRTSLRNRISTWASSVRQSFTAAHQDHSSSLSSSPAPISPSTPTRVIPKPLLSESHSVLPSPYSSPQELSIPTTTTPVLFSSNEDLADLKDMTMATPYSAAPKEAIGGRMPSPLLRLVQETEKTNEVKETAKIHHSHRLYPSAITSTPARSTPKLVVQTTPPKYPAPAAPVCTTAQYTPRRASAFGWSNSRNPSAAPATSIPVIASSLLATPTTATGTKANIRTYTFQSSLERARFLNQSRRRKVGSGLITLFCIAAIVILILC